jgi:hypothetical protein
MPSLPQLPPPLPPLNNNTDAGATPEVALANWAASSNANVDNFGGKLFVPSPQTAVSDDVDLFNKFEHTGKSNAAPPAPSCLFMLGSAA